MSVSYEIIKNLNESAKDRAEEYKNYIYEHKMNVLKALDKLKDICPFCKQNYFILQLLCSKHDASKYQEPEWTPYLKHFYGDDKEKLNGEEFDAACKHHCKNNPHHWDYWVDDENNLIDYDPYEYKLYSVERLCDWMAMSCQGQNNIKDWYEQNRNSMVFAPEWKEFEDLILNEDLSIDGYVVQRGE